MKNLVLAGLCASFVGTAAIADVYYQGFEDSSWLGSEYHDASGLTDGHWLTNNAGESWVNGPGFDAWVDGDGIADGDYIGVTDYTGVVGSWYEGSQGYQMSDTDGVMELHFTGYEGFADTVSIAIFIASTGWETSDNISMHWGDADESGAGALYDTAGADIDDLDIEGEWRLMTFDVSSAGSGHFHIRFESNSSYEAIFIDAVTITGSVVPAPSALALLGLAGIASRRRRR